MSFLLLLLHSLSAGTIPERTPGVSREEQFLENCRGNYRRNFEKTSKRTFGSRNSLSSFLDILPVVISLLVPLIISFRVSAAFPSEVPIIILLRIPETISLVVSGEFIPKTPPMIPPWSFSTIFLGVLNDSSGFLRRFLLEVLLKILR